MAMFRTVARSFAVSTRLSAEAFEAAQHGIIISKAQGIGQRGFLDGTLPPLVLVALLTLSSQPLERRRSSASNASLRKRVATFSAKQNFKILVVVSRTAPHCTSSRMPSA